MSVTNVDRSGIYIAKSVITPDCSLRYGKVEFSSKSSFEKKKGQIRELAASPGLI